MQDGLRFFIILLFFWTNPIFAKNKDQCSNEELRQKNCLLRLGDAHYQFLRENLSIDDGVWKGVVSVPREESASEWLSLKLFEKAGRRFYELRVWTPPVEGVGLQSLHWVVVELKGIKTQTRLDKVIQKRRPLNGQKGKYLKDKIEKYQLKAKGQKIVWSIGHLKGEF